MSDETRSSNSSGNTLNPWELPPPIYEQYLTEVEADEFDLISKQMDKLIEIKKEVEEKKVEIKSDDKNEESFVFNKQYILENSQEISCDDVMNLPGFANVFCQIKSISSNTISKGINPKEIGKYYIIYDYRGSREFNICKAYDGTNYSQDWAIDHSDLIFYKTDDSKIIDLMREARKDCSSTSSISKFFSIINQDKEVTVTYSKITLAKNNYDKLKLANPELHDALQESFPKERYGIYFENDNVYHIRIHYPEITVKNSNGLSAQLKDIVFHLRFIANKIDKLGCLKTTYSLMDISSDKALFVHSHARRIPMSSLRTHYSVQGYGGNEFCLGSGTPIANQVSILKVKIGTFNEYWGFLNSIQPYLEWESLEGVPYHKLSDRVNLLNSKLNVLSSSNSLVNSICNRIANIPGFILFDFLKTMPYFDYFIDSNGKFIFKLNTSKYEDLLKILDSNIRPYLTGTDCEFLKKVYMINNQYYYESGNSISGSDSSTIASLKSEIERIKKEKPILKLSEEVSLPIIIEDDEKQEERVNVILPQFITSLENEINKKINLLHIR